MTRRTFATEAEAVRFVMALPDSAEVAWEQPAGGPIAVEVRLAA